MSDFFHSKGKLSRFLAGKGFYAALAVCVIGAGAAAWVAVDKTVDRIDESNRRAAQPGRQAASSAPEPSYGFPDLEEAGKAQSGVGVQREKEPSSSSSSSTAAASSSAASSAPEAPSVEAKAQPELEPSSFVLPISGEIFVPYSGGELVKDPTLNEWRTHDGIDIKAEPGTPVKAVCDGQVTAVTAVPHEESVTVSTTANAVVLPVGRGLLDLTFTIEANVVNPITTELGTQEVRIGKTHIVKTDTFELVNGTIMSCVWGEQSQG